jgi:DNA-binding CsgD family transcriptional regulator
MPDINDLSERELEILRLVAGGASNKQIAHALTISTNTVKVHLRNIFNKIEVASRTEAAMFAVRSGLVQAGGTAFEGQIAEKEGGKLTDSELSSDYTKKIGLRRLILISIPVVILIVVFLAINNGRSSEAPLQATASPAVVQSLTRWQEGVNMPTRRSGMAVAVFENQIYAVGGETIDGVTGVVERYNPQTRVWETLQEKPHPVSDISAAVIGGRVYIPGGRQANREIISHLEIYDPRQNTWELGAPLPFPISAYAMVAFEGKLFIFGGENEDGYLSSVLVYDPSRDEWDEIEAMPTKRAYAGAAVAAGKIFVIGGFDGQKALAEVEIFMPGLMNGDESPWIVGESLEEGRYKLGVTSLADLIYIFGGAGDTINLDNTFQSLTLTNNWIPIEVDFNYPWISMGLVPIETKIFILGGKIDDEPSGSVLEYQAIYTILIPMIP